jgi:hypothetical protein
VRVSHAKVYRFLTLSMRKKYVIIPNIAHYGVYYQERAQAMKLAIDWFDQYLKK